MEHYQLTAREEYLAKQIVDCAFQIHKSLGPGLLESVYERCFVYELEKRGIAFSRQQLVAIVYEGHLISEGLKIDLCVEDCIIIELKAQENYHPVWEAQLLSYLKLTNKHIGFLINFHVPLIKDGIKRMVLSS